MYNHMCIYIYVIDTYIHLYPSSTSRLHMKYRMVILQKLRSSQHLRRHSPGGGLPRRAAIGLPVYPGCQEGGIK